MKIDGYNYFDIFASTIRLIQLHR